MPEFISYKKNAIIAVKSVDRISIGQYEYSDEDIVYVIGFRLRSDRTSE